MHPYASACPFTQIIAWGVNTVLYMNQRPLIWTRRLRTPSRTQLALLLACFALSEIWGNGTGLAQSVSPITPSGLGTQVDPSDATPAGKVQYDITGGTRVGTNLFHSFGDFNVPHNTIANFLNDTNQPTSTILGRVTGGDGSTIVGAIQTTGFGNANLFLMNPAGIVFGPTATLHVGGSVAFTTADYLRLTSTAGGPVGIFHADPTAPSILTTASVAAFGFLGDNPSAITVDGSTLTVHPTQSLSLVGGNITIQSGTLSFANTTGARPQPTETVGQISLASIASPGEILAATLKPGPNILGHTVEQLGAIHIVQNSRIDTRSADGVGIRIRGGHLVLDSSQLFSTTGAIAVDATSIHVTNASEVTTETTTAAQAGHITLHAQLNIALESGSLILSSSSGSSGHAGSITLQSDQGNITLTEFASVASYSIESSGNTGSIIMNALRGDIEANDSYVYTSAQGTGKLGGIQITANNLDLHNSASIVGNNFTTQVAEPISITTTGRLSMTGNAIIETATAGPADSADLVIRSPHVILSDDSKLITSTTSSGDAGRLNLLTDHLQLTDGAQLSSRSLVNGHSKEIPVGRGGTIRIEGLNHPGTSIRIEGKGSGIFADAQGTGPAGDIFITATTVTLQNGGTISAQTTGTTPTATGGSITIQATDHVSLSNQAVIAASSRGPTAGDAGNITLNAGQYLELRDHSSITTSSESTQANGGNIDIRAIDRVRLVKSEISTSVKGTEGSGGNIFIDPKVVILQSSHVIAQAVGGAGGNITFVTPLFLADQSSLVDASSQFGLNGTVTIQSPIANLSGTVAQLTSQPSSVQLLFQSRCAALAHTQHGSVLLSRHQTTPMPPGEWLNSPFMVASEYDPLHAPITALAQEMPDLENSLVSSASLGSTANLSLSNLTPPGFLVRSFARDEPTGCRL